MECGADANVQATLCNVLVKVSLLLRLTQAHRDGTQRACLAKNSGCAAEIQAQIKQLTYLFS